MSNRARGATDSSDLYRASRKGLLRTSTLQTGDKQTLRFTIPRFVANILRVHCAIYIYIYSQI